MTSFLFFLWILLTLFVFLFVVWKLTRDLPYNDDLLFSMLFTLMIVFFLSSRISFIFLHFNEFLFSPIRWIAFMHFPGFWWFGGLFVSIIALYIFTKKKRMNFFQLLDGVLIGFWFSSLIYMFGRFMSYPETGKTLFSTEMQYPVTLIRFVLLFIGFLPFLYYLLVKKITIRKAILDSHGKFSVFFILYFLSINLFVDFFKQYPVYYIGLSVDQWVCFLIIFSIIFFGLIKYTKKKYGHRNG